MNKLLLFIQIIHILNELFLSTYIFIFNKKYDVYFMIYIFIIFLHWIFLQNECILSYIEKKIINKNYTLGSEPYNHPFRTLISNNVLCIFKILKSINIFVVFIRNLDNIFIVITFILVVIFGIYNYIQKSNIKHKKFKFDVLL